MTKQQTMTTIFYCTVDHVPANVSAGRWKAMVKRILQEFPHLTTVKRIR